MCETQFRARRDDHDWAGQCFAKGLGFPHSCPKLQDFARFAPTAARCSSDFALSHVLSMCCTLHAKVFAVFPDVCQMFSGFPMEVRFLKSKAHAFMHSALHSVEIWQRRRAALKELRSLNCKTGLSELIKLNSLNSPNWTLNPKTGLSESGL